MGNIVTLVAGMLIINELIKSLEAKNYPLAAFSFVMILLLVVAKVIAMYKLQRLKQTHPYNNQSHERIPR